MSRKTRKLIWSAPLVAVLAVIGALAIFAAMAPGSLFATELTDAPLNLVVEGRRRQCRAHRPGVDLGRSGRGRDAHRLPD